MNESKLKRLLQSARDCQGLLNRHLPKSFDIPAEELSGDYILERYQAADITEQELLGLINTLVITNQSKFAVFNEVAKVVESGQLERTIKTEDIKRMNTLKRIEDYKFFVNKTCRVVITCVVAFVLYSGFSHLAQDDESFFKMPSKDLISAFK
jgi:hypothetical protein